MDEWSPPEFEHLSEELIQFIKPELEPGERLLWASRPGLRVQKSGRKDHLVAAVWAVGMFFLSLCCFAATAFSSHPRFESVAFVSNPIGIFSAVICFLIVLGSITGFVSGHSRTELAGQIYALTDRRAIIQIPNSTTQAVTVHTFHRGTIKSELLRRIQYPDGSGDVLFQEAHKQPPGFQDVADVRRVEALIRRFLIVSDSGSTA